jgi:hypothetical protein
MRLPCSLSSRWKRQSNTSCQVSFYKQIYLYNVLITDITHRNCMSLNVTTATAAQSLYEKERRFTCTHKTFSQIYIHELTSVLIIHLFLSILGPLIKNVLKDSNKCTYISSRPARNNLILVWWITLHHKKIK